MKRAQGSKSSAQTPAFGSGSGAGFGGFGSPASGSSLSYLSEPPSFNDVSDPNVVVSLKNILKKDSTTKSKALEDLINYTQDHPYEHDGGVQEAVLEIWVQLYARTSIDSSRRVRELSHTLQFELMKSARKRMERRVPKIVGAWLAGLYDRDRVVARAANAGLSSFLTTPEKVVIFWTRCQSQILDYANDAIHETQDTLSDERSTTKEDAEAKYFRVVTASLSLVLGLLQKIQASDLEKTASRYEGYFSEESVWKSITFNDATVRKTVCQLLFVCLDRGLPSADSVDVRHAFITGGLKTSQAGSALEYVRALTKLTEKHPVLWASGTDKKSPMTRLQAFIAKGSQGSPAKFWAYLEQLLSVIPTDLLTLQAASKLLESVQSGISNREEPRTNTSSAWNCYIEAAKRLLKALSSDDQLAFGRDQLLPLFENFLFVISVQPAIPIPTGLNAISILVEAYSALVQSSSALAAAVGEDWRRLATLFNDKLASSLPEVSKEFQKSQESIAEEGRRWFSVVGQIHSRASESDSLPDYTLDPSRQVISQCMSLLENRNLKPFGAAGILEYALSTSSHVFEGDLGQSVSAFLLSLATQDAIKAIESPSSEYVLSCLGILGGIPTYAGDYEDIWKTWIKAVMSGPVGSSSSSAIVALVSQDQGAKLARDTPEVQKYLVSQSLDTASKGGSWDLLEAAVTHDSISNPSCVKLTQELVERLDTEKDKQEDLLNALQIIAKSKPGLFAGEDDIHTLLVALLLKLTEIGNDSVSSQALALRSLLGGSNAQLPVVSIVQSNLERADMQSLEIDTLVKQAEDAAASDTPLEDIFPSTNVWMKELAPFLDSPINPSVSITNSLGGAVNLVTQASGQAARDASQISRDRKGRSVPARMALYASHLFDANVELSRLPREFQAELLFLQCLTVQLVSDQITTQDENGLWKRLSDPQEASEAENLVSSLRHFINERAIIATWWLERPDDVSAVMRSLVDLLIDQTKSLTPRGLYSARALSEILQAVAETHGLLPSLEEKFLTSETPKAAPATVFLAAAVIAGFGENLKPSKAVSNLFNRLISDIAGAASDTAKTMIALVLLSLSARVYGQGMHGQGALPVANTNRIVFAVKQIISWLDEPGELSPAILAETCRALTELLPCMKDVYGSYWEKAIQFGIMLWNDTGESHNLSERLPVIHASLRLMKTLETIPEPNDDLRDAIKEFANEKPKAIMELLKIPRNTTSQPVDIINSMLCREAQKIQVSHVTDLSDLYGLVASESRDIQNAAFDLLHRAIPERQEQKSVDVLLDKTDARLPDELLSLLLDAPTLERYTDEMLANFPISIRAYLLSWKLVFDSYSTSSIKVRNDFTDNLRTDNYVAPLLEFMFDVLGHSVAHPLNLDKEGLTEAQIRDCDMFSPDADSEKGMQWLLVHLYYLTLKYIPGQFRTWYIDCRSKQTRMAVEAWTSKYFSPLIVADTLEETQKWADEQEPPASDEQELLVKVSRNAREVTAGYEVDETDAAIVIKIPASYPIDGVTVAGLRRVAVTERKWQSWIMTTQGVITFSNGSIIDGLQVFKRNIVGALKGQSECAICYSIISADKRMPDKRCATCKNLFHRTCLYKWFQSSSQNTCPLCRNPIDYLGADTAKRRQV